MTLCLILLVCGLVAVDYNTRRIGFGDDSPLVCIAVSEQGERILKFSAMGEKASLGLGPLEEAEKKAEELLEKTIALLFHH